MRKLRPLTLIVALALVALPTVALAGHKTAATGKANLHQVGKSGIKAKITFVDDGSSITTEGAATGMDPDDSYISPIYDNGSVPGGPFACEPSGEVEPGIQLVPGTRQNSNELAPMVVGFWAVDGDGNGTLGPVVNIIDDPFGQPPVAQYVSLDEFDTTSIRAESEPGTEYGGFGVVACGEVSAQPIAYPARHDTSVTPYVELEDAFVVGAGRYHRRTGDLWHRTWADDGQLYMAWGDGAGRGDCCSAFPGDVVDCPGCIPVSTSVPIFDWNNPGGTGADVCNSVTKYCLCEETYFGLALLGQSRAAAPEHCDGDCIVQTDIPTGVPLPNTTRNDKPSSILSVDGTLYMAGHWPPGNATSGWIADSVDHGVTWDESPNSPWTAPSPFTVMMFIQMGQDYGLNGDGWVYALAMGREAGWQNPAGGLGEIYLARVPTNASPTTTRGSTCPLSTPPSIRAGPRTKALACP